MRHKITGVGARSAAKTGFALGVMVGVPPMLFATALIAWVAHSLRLILEKASHVSITPPALIPPLTLDFVDGLGLKGLLSFLVGFDQFLIYLLVFVAGVIFSALTSAGLGSLAAGAFNSAAAWSGGLDIKLQSASKETGVLSPPSEVVSISHPPSVSSMPAHVSQPASRSAPALGPRLALAANPSQVWPINKPVFSIGSAPTCDLYANGLKPRHAEVRFEPTHNAYVLHDLSDGQVWVNNRLVQKMNKLNDGFQVRVGQIGLVFYI